MAHVTRMSTINWTGKRLRHNSAFYDEKTSDNTQPLPFIWWHFDHLKFVICSMIVDQQSCWIYVISILSSSVFQYWVSVDNFSRMQLFVDYPFYPNNCLLHWIRLGSTSQPQRRSTASNIIRFRISLYHQIIIRFQTTTNHQHKKWRCFLFLFTPRPYSSNWTRQRSHRVGCR